MYTEYEIAKQWTTVADKKMKPGNIDDKDLSNYWFYPSMNNKW